MLEISSNFIKTIMEKDMEQKKHNEIVTRFPPEPNGFLHIGHARAIVINFELAKTFKGKTNLRFDDTNPSKEDSIYVKSIISDIDWLGYKPDGIYYASDYFEEMYDRAIILIKKGLAYVDESTAEEIKKDRGSTLVKGVDSKYRNRSIEENLSFFEEMKIGRKPEGSCVLRVKIDMKSPNMNLRDPVIYRISFEKHHHRESDWKIYPMYDFAHPIEDSIEGITHSLCSLEFEDHRPLYDWIITHTEMKSIPRQIEFGRLNIENTIMSKRYLKELVERNLVEGWDDPRLPTLKGLRRRGFTPNSIKKFIIDAGLSKINSTISYSMLEAHLRDELNKSAPRFFAVKKPLKILITNYPKNKVEYFDVLTNPYSESEEKRKISFSKEIYIDHDDFLLQKPNKKYKRLYLGGEVRLMHAYFVKCNNVIYDSNGNISHLEATYDPETKSGTDFKGRKPNGTIQFVDALNAIPIKINSFEPLIIENTKSTIENFNKDSWNKYYGYAEPYISKIKKEEKFQFVRMGYYCIDKESSKSKVVVNEITALKGNK